MMQMLVGSCDWHLLPALQAWCTGYNLILDAYCSHDSVPLAAAAAATVAAAWPPASRGVAAAMAEGVGRWSIMGMRQLSLEQEQTTSSKPERSRLLLLTKAVNIL